MDYNLIVPFIPNLRRYARALVGDRDGADDLVQDTLERAVRKFHLWRPGDLRAWLFSIMHNVFVNQLKARRIAPEVEIDENALAAPIPAVTSVDVIDLQRALFCLAPEQREVVLLIAPEDMSHAAAAARHCGSRSRGHAAPGSRGASAPGLFAGGSPSGRSRRQGEGPPGEVALEAPRRDAQDPASRQRGVRAPRRAAPAGQRRAGGAIHVPGCLRQAPDPLRDPPEPGRHGDRLPLPVPRAGPAFLPA